MFLEISPGKYWRRKTAPIDYVEGMELVIPTAEIPTDYKSSLHLAEKWLKTCKTTHPSCRCESGMSPSRLLYIGENVVRLSLQNEHPHHTSYSTLSHCWGRSDILKLTTATFKEFQRSIPLKRLCKTLLEAIAVTRTFGFKYLWVDSLCIVQEENDDWIEESALMSTVYGGSELNIAGAGATDGNGGLFFNRISSDFRR